MPTESQISFLQDILTGKITKRDNPHKYSVYMKRIRERIDSEMSSLLWLAENFPEILVDEDYEIHTDGMPRNRRLKAFMRITKLIYPQADPQLVKMKEEIGLDVQ